MSITPEMIERITDTFLNAEAGHQPITQVASLYPAMTMEEAYQVQSALIARLVARGGRPVGKKAAAISAAAQAKMNITEPIYGHLFDFQQANSGQTLSTRHFIQPFIEGELAFIFDRPLAGSGVSEAEVLAATRVVAAFDIIDFRTTEFQVGLLEALCYNVYAVHFVVGTQARPAAGLDLPNLKINLAKNGAPVSSAAGAVLMGNPVRVVAWMAHKLAQHGRQFEVGEIVLTGAITQPQPIKAGDAFEASFEGLESLAINFD